MADKKKGVRRKATGKGKPTVEKGFKFTNATRKKMAQAHTGKKLSDETKRKISEARREREALIQAGLLEPFRHSKETRKKLSLLMKRRKHRPTQAAVAKSAKERREAKKDKALAREIMKG